MALSCASAVGVGGAASRPFGHHVRLDAKVTKDTRLTFMTAGVLLRKMHGDPLLRDVSRRGAGRNRHERSADADFELALLSGACRGRRRALNMRPLKLVVMSATLDAELFCGYGARRPAAAVSAPGRTHPVTRRRTWRGSTTCWSTALDEDSRCCRRPATSELKGRSRACPSATAPPRWRLGRRRGQRLARGREPRFRGGGTTRVFADPISAGLARNLSRLDEAGVDSTLRRELLVGAPTIEPQARGAFAWCSSRGSARDAALARLHARSRRFAPRHGAHKICARDLGSASSPPRNSREWPSASPATCAKSSSPQTSPRPR